MSISFHIVVDELLKEGKAEVTVLRSIDRWYGVTYQEDKKTVVDAIAGFKSSRPLSGKALGVAERQQGY